MMNLNNNDVYRISINFTVPFIFLAIFLFYFFNLKRIQKYLHPQIYNDNQLIRSEELNF